MRIVGTDLDRPSSTQLRAMQFGYASLIPFALAAILIWMTPGLFTYELAMSFIGWVLIYGAIVVSFLGGARWGVAIRDWRPDRLIFTAFPLLLGWAAVVPNQLLPGLGMGSTVRFGILLVAFLFLLTTELIARNEWSPWYRGLRMRLTLATTGFLLLTILGLTRF